MTDPQILTIAIAIVVPLSMLLYSNSRITDTKEILRSEMQTLRAEMLLQFERLSNKLDHLAGEVANLKAAFETHL